MPAILGWRGPGGGGQRQERPAARHAGVVHAAWARVVHRPTGCTGAPASTWSPLTACRDWRGACRAAAESVRGRQGRGHHGGRRVLVRHGGQAAGPALRRRRTRRAHHDRCRALGRHPGGRRGGGHPRARGATRGAPGGAGDLVPRRAHAQFHLHHGRDRARPLRPCTPRTASGRQLRAGPAPRRAPHPVSVCARTRPTPAARVLHRADPARAGGGVRVGDEVGPPARSATPGRARRGGAHRTIARARRPGGDLCVARDPDRDGMAGPGPGAGPLRRPGPDGPEQPPRQAVPPGIADPDTLEYASRLIGDEETSHPSETRDHTGRRSTTSTTGPRRLLPPESLRCLERGRAVLVYGTLPPARLRLRPWWAQAGVCRRRLRRARTW